MASPNADWSGLRVSSPFVQIAERASNASGETAGTMFLASLWPGHFEACPDRILMVRRRRTCRMCHLSWLRTPGCREGCN